MRHRQTQLSPLFAFLHSRYDPILEDPFLWLGIHIIAAPIRARLNATRPGRKCSRSSRPSEAPKNEVDSLVLVFMRAVSFSLPDVVPIGIAFISAQQRKLLLG
ncbi:hypothetical protein J3458_003214 [Metarhizium acridum]|uniref:uncharacterized protein n=1 Tax=Metarhizium acridum TaxID=92637 RepID=UPI001C6C511D|nr:hypothetical protein J3458_003214 [Metarhizium acridum]